MKRYIKPLVSVVEMNTNQQILAGSNPQMFNTEMFNDDINVWMIIMNGDETDPSDIVY